MSRAEKYRAEQVRRLHRLVDDLVQADDVELTDLEFVETVSFRFERQKLKRKK